VVTDAGSHIDMPKSNVPAVKRLITVV
jgi:hypothetical protein